MRKLESQRRHFFSLKNRYGHGRTGRTFAAGPAHEKIYEFMVMALNLFTMHLALSIAFFMGNGRVF